MGYRKQILTVRVVTFWQRLPRKAVDALCLELFKTRLDWFWSNLVLWEVLKQDDL